MKKLLTFLLSVAITVIPCLALAGCSSATEISFTKDFDAEYSLDYGNKETAVYNVSFNDNYDSTLRKNPKITDSMLTFDTQGTYTTVLSKEIGTVALYDGSNLASLNSPTVYRYTTTLSLNVTYTLNGGEQQNVTDTITTETFFLDKDYAYAPIRSTTAYDCTHFSIGENPSANKLVYNASVLYNKNGATSSVTTADASKKTSVEYTLKTLIDNTQLLFALRNFTVAVNKSATFAVKTYAYDKATYLRINNKGKSTLTLDDVTVSAVGSPALDYNGEVSVPVKSYAFKIDEKYNTGINKLVFIQEDKVADKLCNRSIVCEYVEPVMSGATTVLGALVYKLSSFTVD